MFCNFALLSDVKVRKAFKDLKVLKVLKDLKVLRDLRDLKVLKVLKALKVITINPNYDRLHISRNASRHGLRAGGTTL